MQVQGKNRELVAETARKLGLDGSYIPRSYIEQVRICARSRADAQHARPQAEILIRTHSFATQLHQVQQQPPATH